MPGGGGGGRLLLKITGEGVLQEGEGPRGWEVVCGELGNFRRGGGGAKYFFSGPKCPPSNNRAFFLSLPSAQVMEMLAKEMQFDIPQAVPASPSVPATAHLYSNLPCA